MIAEIILQPPKLATRFKYWPVYKLSMASLNENLKDFQQTFVDESAGNICV